MSYRRIVKTIRDRQQATDPPPVVEKVKPKAKPKAKPKVKPKAGIFTKKKEE